MESKSRPEFVMDDETNPDYISTKEFAALQELKEKEIAQHFTDRMLLVFLFGRKLDIKRTTEMLEGYRKWRIDEKFEKPLTHKDFDMSVLKTVYSWAIAGKRDKEGRAVGYIVPALADFHSFKARDMILSAVWLFEKSVEFETLDIHRKGVVYIEDLKGVKLTSFSSQNSKEVSNALMNHIPLRIQAIYILNPGFVFKFLLGFAKLFMKAKIVKRAKAIKSEELLDYVTADNLDVKFGGNVKYDHGAWLQERIDEENKALEQ